ncbi:MAG: hypothetical protein AVDCRST_MAG73-4200 [uncultured Thermomicrobiales bacterium]|uniref:Uncharacterized protein n=1 Tax=uncultured Thermomicrobiales bacterium TaxID=1645740 RepID=A0A6J4V0W0_9BACT|nr:MAG: hypothetical protein AVDCRST_MAG73-4200 [uncultured Thermomicrobiales bacterium]
MSGAETDGRDRPSAREGPGRRTGARSCRKPGTAMEVAAARKRTDRRNRNRSGRLRRAARRLTFCYAPFAVLGSAVVLAGPPL